MGGEETPARILNQELKMKAGAMILANALHFKGIKRHLEDMENMVRLLEMGLWEGKASVLLLLPFHVESWNSEVTESKCFCLYMVFDRKAMLRAASSSSFSDCVELSKHSVHLRLLTPFQPFICHLACELQPPTWLPDTLSLRLRVTEWAGSATLLGAVQKQLATLGLEVVWNETSDYFTAESRLGKGKLHLGAVMQWMSLELDHVFGSKDDVQEDEHVFRLIIPSLYL
ncbi:hypothetical protein E1301_Tti005205 [Triplophysa tibetana]|uniref:Uncharacterized protein n=1 Tax=Triplophysa tibetana TaxID=1572043 RepID=A0A5A9PQ32_9TELE|nr:hypothetical protein E1301_Tti005205 [Triplophysa tibetana]